MQLSLLDVAGGKKVKKCVCYRLSVWLSRVMLNGNVRHFYSTSREKTSRRVEDEKN